MGFQFEKKRSALLIMDYQQSIVESFSGAGPDLLGRCAQARDAAHQAGMAVIYVVIGFRPGYPEVSMKNKSFGQIREGGRFVNSSAGSEVHPTLSPKEGDVIVMKRRVSAFSGSDLDMVLRAKDIDTLVLAGIATSGVVLSTLRQAADLDYRLVVLKDGCSDRDAQVHDCLMEKVFPRQAEVMNVEQFIVDVKTP